MGRAIPAEGFGVGWFFQRFNPRPAVGPGDTRGDDRNEVFDLVSIRARPLGRAILGSPGTNLRFDWFQSAPGRWAGRYMTSPMALMRSFSFNPRPAVGPGDTNAMLFLLANDGVSIRARPLGRAIRLLPWRIGAGGRSFNPRPAVGPGDTASCRTPDSGRTGCFNPRPAVGPGDTPAALPASPTPCSQFQSAPGRWAGRYSTSRTSSSTYASFNPRPAVGPGDTA